MADGATRSPARLCSRDGKICYYYRRLEYDFSCFLRLTSFSPFFLLPYPGMFIFLKDFVSLRLCSSHLLLSASKVRILFYVFYLLVSLVSCPISESLSNSSYLSALNSYPQNGTIQISSCITKHWSNSSDTELPRDMFRFNPSRITLVGILSNPFVFIRFIFFRSSCFSSGIFCCALVPGTLALDLPIYMYVP